jgi:uncharacterized protein YbaR (Trm112 family)
VSSQSTVDPRLLEILRCPSQDHAPLDLVEHDGATTLVCTYCKTSYPVRDGIPVMLVDEATPGPHGIGVQA